MAIWEETILERTVRPSFTTAAAVSSQDVSIQRRSIYFQKRRNFGRPKKQATVINKSGFRFFFAVNLWDAIFSQGQGDRGFPRWRSSATPHKGKRRSTPRLRKRRISTTGWRPVRRAPIFLPSSSSHARLSSDS